MGRGERLVIILLATIPAAFFGACVQYLGSFSMHPWMADVSLLSAPWLALAFLAGCTQRDPKRAALLGLVCTFAAWVGYGAMTLSPVEGAEMSVPAWLGFIRSQRAVILGGIVTGPLFGWFGHRWRADRAWLGALVTATAFCLEPLARNLYGFPIGSSTVVLAEVALGIAMAAYIGAQLATGRGPTTRPTVERPY
jgi:hypothetical protein